MTWKKGFYANDRLNLTPTLCRHTQTDAGTLAQTGTHQSPVSNREPHSALCKRNYFSLWVLNMDHAQGEKRGVVSMKSDITPEGWVYVCMCVWCYLGSLKERKSLQLSHGKGVLHLQRAGQTQQTGFIEMFIHLRAPWEPEALHFLQASDRTQTHIDN